MTCDQLLDLKENTNFEVKAAQGRHGNGEVPNDLWETYSSFANTEGGLILLGAEELEDGSLRTLGIKQIDKVQKEFWSTLNNPQKINQNILSASDVKVITCDALPLLLINVPRADRKNKPIYRGENPLTGTYIRYHEGDMKATRSLVEHMLADALHDSEDTTILNGFNLDDLDLDSLAKYRNVFNAAKMDHPWSGYDDLEFLRALGAYGRERVGDKEGLTLAGLLMFGKMRSILDGVPHYIVDYQEHSENPEDRWLDRITTDGTWSGNLYDFALKSYRKLTEDLKVPFRLKDNVQRIDESHVHQALREALVNTLIHGNYAASTGILIIKHPQKFSFRNPGLLRISLDKAFEGGNSDCRNRTLQKMFQFIGWGEQAGSGFPKMWRAWNEQHWQRPRLVEDFRSEYTTLLLPTVSLIPEEIQDELIQRFGETYNELTKDERVVLVIAQVEKEVTNQRVSEITTLHPSDTTKILRGLVDRNLLSPAGAGRGTTYHLPTEEERLHHSGSSLHLKDMNLHHKALVAEVKDNPRSKPKAVQDAILALCKDQYLTKQELASLLSRKVATLRNNYLRQMLKEGLLEQKFKEANHPQQAYKTKSSINWDF